MAGSIDSREQPVPGTRPVASLLHVAVQSLTSMSEESSFSLEAAVETAHESTGGAIAGLSLFDESCRLVVRACVGVPGVSVGDVVDLQRTLVGRATARGEPVRVASRADEGLYEPSGVKYGPAMAVPIKVGGAVIGAASVGRRLGEPEYTQADLDELAAFGEFMGVLIELERTRSLRQAADLVEAQERIANRVFDTAVGDLMRATTGMYGLLSAVDDEHRGELARYIESVEQAVIDLRRALFEPDADEE